MKRRVLISSTTCGDTFIEDTGNVVFVSKKGIERLRSTELRDGYKRLTYHKNGKTKHDVIHRLVAIAFIPNPHNKPEVNHKDGNKLNNAFWNLEWSTGEENIEHSELILGNSIHYQPVIRICKNTMEVLEEIKSTTLAIKLYKHEYARKSLAGKNTPSQFIFRKKFL